MVYINIQDTAPVVYIPANGWAGGLTNLGFCLKNTVDGQEVEMQVNAASSAGFLIRLVLEPVVGIITGEWKYSLVAWNEPVDTIATGLVKFFDGDKPGSVEYESELNVIQYAG